MVKHFIPAFALFATAITLQPGMPVAMDNTPAPMSVTVAGSFQDEIGCPGDWQPECAVAYLAYDTADDVWQATIAIPPGDWSYKAALNDGWDENYGTNATPDGPDIGLGIADVTEINFYYDHKSHWVTDSINSLIATVPGNFQAQLGCSGDWQPDCLRSWLQDADGDGIYEFTTDALAPGTYAAKVAHNESWSENYGQDGIPDGPDIPFTVGDSDTVTFRYDPSTHILTILTAGAGAGHDNNIIWDALAHNSRDGLYRNPRGAVPTGTDVTLRLRAASGDLTAAKVRIWNDRVNAEMLLDMTVAADDGTYEYWEATVPGASVANIYWYRFIAIDGTAVAYYEDDDAGTGGWGQTFADSQDRSWQLTAYDANFHSPDWVKNAVIYQIFADRFRDGDPSNNTPAGSFFYGAADTIFRSNGSDWNTPICDPRGVDASACPGKFGQNFYGGDLQGIIDKLDYLQDLGITALYLNPIFESPSNHKYDTTDFLSIDDNFGVLDDPAASAQLFADLAEAAHARGIRIILDGVFNHTSSDSVYFDRYARYPGEQACEAVDSPQRAWYYFEPVDEPGTGVCAGDTNYESWFGYDSLPKLDATNPEVRDLIFASSSGAVASHWLQWADGWRLDVAGDVDPGITNNADNDYWELFRDAVRAANPEAYIVGEEWGLATAWTLGPEWDATMNYQLSSALLSFWRDTEFVDNDHNTGSSAGTLTPIAPSTLEERLRNLEERYPAASFAALMNLLGSHDTNRPLFMLDHNAGAADQSLYNDPNYDWSDAINRLKGVALLQLTLPGAPTIYYGDEIGLVGPLAFDGAVWQDDPYNRIPYPWLDESGTPFYTHLQTEVGQAELRDHYRTLIAARNAHPALRTGSFDTLLIDDSDGIYAYGRRSGTDAAVVIVNRTPFARDVTLDVAGYLPISAGFTDVLSGSSAQVDAAGQLTVAQVPGASGVVLVADTALATPPEAIGDLGVVDADPGQISLAWTGVGGASTYRIYRSLLSGGGFAWIADTTNTAYTDIGLSNGTRYHYRIMAINAATGLESAPSNEVSGVAQHNLATSWFNLQWPPEMTHVISTTTPTEPIFAQIWIDGFTGPDGPADGIQAQVGFGAIASPPDESWTWADMTFHAAVGNNDEYIAQLLPNTLGDFQYMARWSADGGETWYVSDLGGPGDNGQRGELHVVPSDDVVAPAIPTGLAIDATSPAAIAMSWNPVVDSDLAGYEVYRDDMHIATVNADTTGFTDGTVTTGGIYTYFLKAFDTSFNRSAPSQAVTATAAAQMVAVTFRVTVPDVSPGAVYIAGGFPEPLPFWEPGGIALEPTGVPGVWEVTLELLDGTSLEYKFTRGTWETVEKEADGNTEIVNRNLVVELSSDGTQIVDHEVLNWRDPLVATVAPLADASQVPVETTISAQWNQEMHDAVVFEVTGPSGPVAGTVTHDTLSFTTTFAPSIALSPGATYTVVLANQADAGGDIQQVPVEWSFTTAAPTDTTPPEVTVDFTPIAVGHNFGLFAVRYDCSDADPDISATADLNGIAVTPGQRVLLIRHRLWSVVAWLGQLLMIVDQDFLLTATCVDTAGNATTVTREPVFD